MSLDENIKLYLAEQAEADSKRPLPEGWEAKFGLKGKFQQYSSIAAMEAANMEHSSPKYGPFAYTIPDWEERKKKWVEGAQEGDQYWKLDCGPGVEAIMIVRNGKIMMRDYPAVNSFVGYHPVSLPDPDFFITLSTL